MSHVDEAYLPGHFSPASQHGEELAQTKSQRLCDMNKIDIRVHIASKLRHTFTLRYMLVPQDRHGTIRTTCSPNLFQKSPQLITAGLLSRVPLLTGMTLCVLQTIFASQH